MEKAGYFLLRIAVSLFSILPFRLLYRLSDMLSFLFFHFFKYRCKVIETNLQNAFPQKSSKEIKRIMRGFYRNFCDVLLESIKGLTMSQKALLNRFQYLNPEIFDDLFEAGQSAILVGSHFANWEWGALSFPHCVKHKVAGVFKPLSNQYLDRYFNRKRKQWGLQLVSMTQAGRALVQLKNEPNIFVFLADQTPVDVRNAHWLSFFNQDTPFLHGVDKIARRTGYPVYFFDIQRVNRGRYEVTFSELCQNSKRTEKGEITKRFAARLEKIIRKQPENWLWSHRRWKRKRLKPSPTQPSKNQSP